MQARYHRSRDSLTIRLGDQLDTPAHHNHLNILGSQLRKNIARPAARVSNRNEVRHARLAQSPFPVPQTQNLCGGRGDLLVEGLP